MSNTTHSDKEICQSIVGKISELSVLKLTETEKESYKHDFEALIKMFHALDDVDINMSQSEPLLVDIDQCRDDQPQSESPDLEVSSPYFNTSSNLFDVPQLFKDDNE
jgi:aspartyl/glutamyl-tRNA(Asn/Gln) amidotransferase C subunit